MGSHSVGLCSAVNFCFDLEHLRLNACCQVELRADPFVKNPQRCRELYVFSCTK